MRVTDILPEKEKKKKERDEKVGVGETKLIIIH